MLVIVLSDLNCRSLSFLDCWFLITEIRPLYCWHGALAFQAARQEQLEMPAILSDLNSWSWSSLDGWLLLIEMCPVYSWHEAVVVLAARQDQLEMLV